MQATTGGLWAARLENVLEPVWLSVWRLERRGGAEWRIEAIYDSRPAAAPRERALRAILKRDPNRAIRRVPQRDWLA